jgi:hypothetical protein
MKMITNVNPNSTTSLVRSAAVWGIFATNAIDPISSDSPNTMSEIVSIPRRTLGAPAGTCSIAAPPSGPGRASAGATAMGSSPHSARDKKNPV